MKSQQEKAANFAALHIKGSPVILFNSWDPGSTKAVADQGAQAVALGSHGVANANGYEDGQNIPLELVLANAKRSVEATELPLTLDFETGYGDTPPEVVSSVTKALQAGIIGVNIEDQISGAEGLYSIEDQVERLKAVRTAGDQFGVSLFINARTDLFKNASVHDEALLHEALERAKAYAEAGASGFFVPGIRDAELIQKLTDKSPLPVNIIYLEGIGMPEPAELATLGASRISYGPGPYLKMIEWFSNEANKALN